jgi:hypothetical protein
VQAAQLQEATTPTLLQRQISANQQHLLESQLSRLLVIVPERECCRLGWHYS